MVIRLSHRIASLTMALLLLLSSTGFSIDVHYCQDQLMGISFMGKAKSCHDHDSTSLCHHAKKTCHDKIDKEDNSEKDKCCHNESIVIKKSETDATSPLLASTEAIHLDFVTAFVAVYFFNYKLDTYFQTFEQYKPPLPDRDFLLLYQFFLI